MTLLLIGLGAVVMVAAALVAGTVLTAVLLSIIATVCWAVRVVRGGLTALAARGEAAEAPAATYLPSTGTPA